MFDEFIRQLGQALLQGRESLRSTLFGDQPSFLARLQQANQAQEAQRGLPMAQRLQQDPLAEELASSFAPMGMAKVFKPAAAPKLTSGMKQAQAFIQQLLSQTASPTGPARAFSEGEQFLLQQALKAPQEFGESVRRGVQKRLPAVRLDKDVIPAKSVEAGHGSLYEALAPEQMNRAERGFQFQMPGSYVKDVYKEGPRVFMDQGEDVLASLPQDQLLSALLSRFSR